MKKILVVDDHPAMLEGLGAVLRAEGYEEVETVSSSAEALQAVDRSGRFDAIVVDVQLKDGLDGLDLIRELRDRTDSPVVIYTMHDEVWNLPRLLKAGVQGIVRKNDSIDELIAAVKAVTEGGMYHSHGFSERMLAIDSTNGILSDMDIRILSLISDGVESKDIADRICVSKKTVEYHRSNIINKLKSNNMAQAIQKAVRLGILTVITAVVPGSAYSVTPVPQAIDLGLSVKWADCNLGAATSHEAGGFYAFGEVTEKENYDWSTYIHCDDGDMFSQHNIGEESICGTEYDAAHVILGENWRMPTTEEIEELIANCTLEFIEDEPYTCLRATSAGGVYIDFPLTGYMNMGRLIYDNREMTVWSGSFYVDAGEEDGFTYYYNAPFYFGAQKPGISSIILDGNASLGMQIRPVYCGDTTGVTSVCAEEASSSPQLFTIDGRRMPVGCAPAPGLYIKKQGSKTTKLLVR